MLAGVGAAVRTVCASNLVFVRSRSAVELDDNDSLLQRCWPTHELILDIVRPRCIVSFGGEVSRFISSQGLALCAAEFFPSGHGSWECSYSRISLRGRETVLISLPHLSRYAIDHHPEVYEWMRLKVL